MANDKSVSRECAPQPHQHVDGCIRLETAQNSTCLLGGGDPLKLSGLPRQEHHRSTPSGLAACDRRQRPAAGWLCPIIERKAHDKKTNPKFYSQTLSLATW